MTGHLDHTGYLIKNACLIEAFYVIGEAKHWRMGSAHRDVSVSWFQGSMLGVATKAQADENCLFLSNSSDSSFLDTEACRQ